MSLGAGHQLAPWFLSNCSATQIFEGCPTGRRGLVEAEQDTRRHETASRDGLCVPSESVDAAWADFRRCSAVSASRRVCRRPLRAMLCFGNYFLQTEGDFPNPGERRAHTKPECGAHPRQPSETGTSAFSRDAPTRIQRTEMSEKLM